MTQTPIKPSSFGIRVKLISLKSISKVATELVDQKQKNLDLERRFLRLQARAELGLELKRRENLQELKKPKKESLKKGLKDGATQLAFGLFDLYKIFVGYKIIEWISKPENMKAVGEIAKALGNIFKVVDFVAGIGIEGLLGGAHSAIFGETRLEKIFGVFKFMGGFFIMKRLLSPGQILKDISWIFKNRKEIGNIFKTLGDGKFKNAIGRIFKLLHPRLYSVYAKGLTHSVKRVILNVFGKGAFKIFTRLAAKLGFSTAKQFVKTSLLAGTKALTKIPLLGPILGFGLNLLMGDKIDRAAIKMIGSAAGAWLGGIVMGALGSIIPIAGTAAGAGFGVVVGGLIGDWVGNSIYNGIQHFTGPKEPELAVGGIVTKPTRALIGEAGPEAVIPLGKLYNGTLLNAPLAVLSASLLGAMDAVITSLGPVGIAIRPYATHLMAPYRREFGMNNYTFSSDIGTGPVTLKANKQSDTNGDLDKIVGTKTALNVLKKPSDSEESKLERYNPGNTIREILADILNNVLNLDFNKKNSKNGKGRNGGGGNGSSGGNSSGGVLPGDAPPEVKAMLDAISEGEGSWNSVNSGLVISGLSNMTLAEARETGMRIYREGRGSGALGKWQQMPIINGVNTFKQRVEATGLNYNTDKFNEENQTKIARMLMASVYPGGEAQLVIDAQQNPLKAAANLRGTWPSLPGGSQANTHSNTFVSRYTENVKKYAKMQTGGAITRGDITSHFGNQESFRKHAHEGTDVGLKQGTPLSFAIGGKFMSVARTASTERTANGGYGQYMDVKLTDGKIARMAHLSSIPDWVKQGASFGPDTVIALSGGAVGSPGAGRSGGPHLHLEQHSTKQDLAETLNGKVDPATGGILSLLRKGGSTTPSTSTETSTTPISEDSVPESAPEEKKEADWGLITKELGNLYQMLNSPQQFNGQKLQQESMDFVQAFKDVGVGSDTYIMAGGTNILSQTNILTPVPLKDYSLGSFSSMDSFPQAFTLDKRL